MYQNTIHICISWYSKICWFPVKKCWCQHNSTGVSRDLYIVWIFFDQGRTVPSFIFVGYVWQILGRSGGVWVWPSTHPWAAPKKPILNRANIFKSLTCSTKSLSLAAEPLLFISVDVLHEFATVPVHISVSSGKKGTLFFLMVQVYISGSTLMKYI